MKIALLVLLILLDIFVVLAVGGGLLALLAYGLGWLLNRVMQVEPFQATALALGAMLAFGILAERMWRVIVSPSPFSSIRPSRAGGSRSSRLIFRMSNLMTVARAAAGASTRIVMASSSRNKPVRGNA